MKTRYVYGVAVQHRSDIHGWTELGFVDGQLFSTLKRASKIWKQMVDRGTPYCRYTVKKFKVV